MFDFIRDHALKNVWCNQDPDSQFIFEPYRLTPADGVIVNCKVMWRNIALPDNTSYWHVYQIGQVNPTILGLFNNTGNWTSFADVCNQQKMICDIYTNLGVQLPRMETYYMYNNDKDIIIAVRNNSKIPFDFTKDTVYIRLYTNPYFSSLQADATNDFIKVQGSKCETTQAILDFQNTFNQYKQLPGLVYCFVNGYKIDSINPFNVQVGDIAEFVYDSSVKKVIDFKLSDLNTFQSTLDNKFKYLLHYPGFSNTIDFLSSIDFFIIDKYNQNQERGVYYHKNMEDAVRMVTHQDYSVVVAYIMGYVNILQQKAVPGRIINPQNLIIRLHIRYSGYQRSVVFENNRIKELYKLSDTDLVRAMVGMDSTVPNWTAANLENSFYTEIMGSNHNDITRSNVEQAYGYNALSKILGDTPTPTYTNSNLQSINVPYGLQNNSTAYEYDSNGVLLEYNYHNTGSIYTANNPDTRLIEMISGKGSKTLNDIFGTNNITLLSSSNYRVYVCKMLNGVPDNIWKDVTGTDSYIVSSGVLKWADNKIDPLIRVRTTYYFLCNDLQLQANTGVIEFSLDNLETRAGVTAEYVMQVPMGEIDVFLNGRSLIKNLDYFIQFPKIVIINKEYLINPLTDLQSVERAAEARESLRQER